MRPPELPSGHADSTTKLTKGAENRLKTHRTTHAHSALETGISAVQSEVNRVRQLLFSGQ